MNYMKQNIERYISVADTTKSAFARTVGISRSAFYEKLEGNSSWLLDEAITISECLGCTIDELIGKQLFD